MSYGFQHEGQTFTPDGTPPIAETKEACDERNRALSRREVEAFLARSADSWFAYWQEAKPGPQLDMPSGVRPNAPRLTTWMGDTLAYVTWWGAEYTSPAFGPFPSRRTNFRARGIDGREWYGTYYKSSGDYVRMRAKRN